MSVQLGLTTSEAGSLSRAVAEFVRLGQREPSGPMAQLKAVHYPDGRIGYPELGILCGAGETLAQALAQRTQELLAELFHRAMVPAAFREWDFDSFPLEQGKGVAYRVARAYAAAHTDTNLMLVGATGTGKTGLAVCILKARLMQGVPSLFASVPELLDRFRATFDGQGNYNQLMTAVKEVDFLTLDDLGAHHATDWAREKLFQIIGYRHDWLLPTVITSDWPLADLEAIISRRVLARIVEHGEVVEVGGKDLRLSSRTRGSNDERGSRT